MVMLHQHPEGLIYVRTDEGVYGDTLENFKIDYGSIAPMLPEGITERIYEPSKRHALIMNHDVIDGGPMPWLEGDEIISGIQRMLKSQKARELILAAQKEQERINMMKLPNI